MTDKPKRRKRYRYHYLLRMPMTEAVTDQEGGEWIPFGDFIGSSIHSIKFVGGHEWDCVNGWRNTETSSTAGRGLTCRVSKTRDAPNSYKRIATDKAYRQKVAP